MRRVDAAPRAASRQDKPDDKPLPTTAPAAPLPAAGGTAPATHGRSQAAAVLQRRHEDEQRGVQSWVKDLARRNLQPAHDAGSAPERLAALRGRIAAKQQMQDN